MAGFPEQALAKRCPDLVRQGPEREITGLCADSRQVHPGFLFAALPGSRDNGGRFISQALAAGAVAVLHDGSARVPNTVSQWIHPAPRIALAALAAAFYGYPHRQMTMMAITGTNGKTTVAAMIASILAANGQRVGVIGTTGIRHPGITRPNPLTTPDPVLFHATLREMADNGCSTVVAEVSSHALTQHRTAGIPWKVAVFTNLSRDHLDYHGSEAHYFHSKAALFLDPGPETAVINRDDARGRQLADLCTRPIILFGAAKATPPPPFTAEEIRLSWQETRFVLTTPNHPVTIRLPAAGRFNVANALAAAAACWPLGLREQDIQQGLAAFPPAPGRMQPVDAGQPFPVIVDYAHTPQALERLLATARELTRTGRIVLLFGCGGDRDPGKRALMGQTAARLADVVIITDDNPRSEDPAAIRAMIQAGCCQQAGKPCPEIPDRAQAIGHVLTIAKPGDAVLIAGKGHELVQITATGSHPFDDLNIARSILATMTWSPPR